MAGTANGGTNWAQQTAITTNGKWLTGISCSDTQNCTAVGLNGPINGLHSSTADGGATWSVGATTQQPLTGVSCTGASQCLAAQLDGGVYVMSGRQEGVASTAETGALFGVSCASPGTCFAAGDFRIVVKTTNGGKGWTMSGSADSELRRPAARRPGVCYAAGGYRRTRARRTSSRRPIPVLPGFRVGIGDVSGAIITAISCPGRCLLCRGQPGDLSAGVARQRAQDGQWRPVMDKIKLPCSGDAVRDQLPDDHDLLRRR